MCKCNIAGKVDSIQHCTTQVYWIPQSHTTHPLSTYTPQGRSHMSGWGFSRVIALLHRCECLQFHATHPLRTYTLQEGSHMSGWGFSRVIALVLVIFFTILSLESSVDLLACVFVNAVQNKYWNFWSFFSSLIHQILVSSPRMTVKMSSTCFPLKWTPQPFWHY